jgi:hypothetical protein
MNNNGFDKLLTEYSAIKEKYVTPRLQFYRDHVNNKRRLAQWSRVSILLLSLAIPVVATSGLEKLGPVKIEIIISLMSLLIALTSGLEGLHQWQRTWREYSSRIVQIEGFLGSWETDVMSARYLADSHQVSEALRKATERLLQAVGQSVLTEMDIFFSERSRAQQDPRAADDGTARL